MSHDDPFLAALIAAVSDDPETVGLLLHGSRAVGHQRPDSDYDLIRIVTAEAYDARRARSALVEKLTPDGQHRADVLYQTPSRIESYVFEPGLYTASYLSARILFDRTGEIGTLLARLAAEAGKISRDRLAAGYDDYLNSFVRSIKAARRGDELGRRLHAAESATASPGPSSGSNRPGRRITTTSRSTFRRSSRPRVGHPATCRRPSCGSPATGIRRSSKTWSCASRT
jgi:predicted nucleotidyltransferase